VGASRQAIAVHGTGVGQRAEWSEERGLDWYQLGEDSFSIGVARMVRDINGIYRGASRAVVTRHQPEGYSWIDANDSANNVLSFLRFGDDGSMLACVFNFSGSEHTRYRLGLPHAGSWREVLNTDADIYNGTGIGNYGAVEATDEPWHGRTASAVMVLAAVGRALVRTGLVQRVGEVAPARDHLGIGRGRTARTARSAGVRTLVRSSPAVRLISPISRANAPATFC